MSALTKEQIDALPGLVARTTPGPWEQDGIAISHLSKPYGYPQDVCLMGEPLQYAGDVKPMLDNHDANARLIALAPSLAATVIEQQRIITALSEDASRVAELELEVERLREALTPFCDAAEECDEYGQDDHTQAPVTAGQCREARAALDAKP